LAPLVKITYRQDNGDAQIVEVREGDSLMSGAVFNGVAGIEGLCGGSIACGTCHIIFLDEWSAVLDAPGASELELLEALGNRQPASRLGCQIVARPDMDGLVVRVPKAES
jgi:2Fe-2S ferredoxin